MAMVFCLYSIFKSNFCLPRCSFSLSSSSLTSYYCCQNSPVQSSHRQKSHQHCKTIVFLKLPSQSQISFKRSSQSYQISRFHQVSILSLRGGVRDILAHQSHLPVTMVFCLYGIFKSNLVFLGVFFRCVHLLWLPTIAVKTLRYSHAIIRSRINITRPLPSSNYHHRAKFHSRDLLNLIKFQDFIKFPS